MSPASPVATALTGLDDDRVYAVNDAFLSLTDWERDTLLGRSLREVGWWEDSAARRTVVRKVRSEGAVTGIEAVFRTRTGLRREAIVSAELVGESDAPRVLIFFHDVTERNRLQRRLEHLTLHDPLTGLPNRTRFRRTLNSVVDRLEGGGAFVGVLLMDLDRFKVVNDALGHQAGDELLRAVADRVRSCCVESDLPARFGGDEFAVILERPNESEIRAAADRIARALGAPFEVGGIQVRLSTSIGLSVGASHATHRPEDLVRFADLALRRASEAQGTTVEAFDPDRDTYATESLHRENELWTALARDELALVYQPIVSLGSGGLAGCEALVRWNHPERGLVAPGEFVPLAEESGLILRMGNHVLERACADSARWMDRVGSGFVVSVNLSPRQFQEPDFVETVGLQLSRTPFSSGGLQLEITESAVVRAVGCVERLRDQGVRIAIDDFGTGFSSLQYLRDLDVDTLKIDASFTGGIGLSERDEHIIRAIVRFAHGLGVEVVAEGIENVAQHEFLREVGCDFAQGFLYSPPLDPEHFDELLQTGSSLLPG